MLKTEVKHINKQINNNYKQNVEHVKVVLNDSLLTKPFSTSDTHLWISGMHCESRILCKY